MRTLPLLISLSLCLISLLPLPVSGQEAVKRYRTGYKEDGYKGYSPYNGGSNSEGGLSRQTSFTRNRGRKGQPPHLASPRLISSDKEDGYKGYSPYNGGSNSEGGLSRQTSFTRNRGRKGQPPHLASPRLISSDKEDGYKGYSPYNGGSNSEGGLSRQTSFTRNRGRKGQPPHLASPRLISSDKEDGYKAYSPYNGGSNSEGGLSRQTSFTRNRGRKGQPPHLASPRLISSDKEDGYKGYSPYNGGSNSEGGLSRQTSFTRNRGRKGQPPHLASPRLISSDKKDGYKGYSPYNGGSNSEGGFSRQTSFTRNRRRKGQPPHLASPRLISSDKEDGYKGYSSYNGGSSSEGGLSRQTSFTRNRGRKGVRGAAAGSRGSRTAYNFQGKKKTRGRTGMRFRKKPPTFKEWAAMSEEDRAAYRGNLRSASNKNSDGSGAQFGQNFRNADKPQSTLVSRSKKGKRNKARAFGRKCGNAVNMADCNDLNIVDSKRNAAKIAGKNRKEGEQRGTAYLRKKGRRTEPYFYRVDCAARTSRANCGSSPTELRSPNGDVWKCNPRRKGDVTVTKCCKNSRRCVTSNQDSDGTVYVGKGGVQTARTKCRKAGTSRTVEYKDEDGRTKYDKTARTKCRKAGTSRTVEYKDEDGRTKYDKVYQKYECGADSTGTSQTNVEDSEWSDAVSCDGKGESDKRIVVEKPKYYPDKTKAGGYTTMEFPHCGRMEAWVRFNNFTQAELRYLGPRLAFQIIVNAAPAGQVKCQDTSTCLTNRKGPNKEDNCYYCDLCNKSKHKLLATADTEGVCQQITSGRVKLSVRICPFNEDTSNGLCATSSKSIHSTYGGKKGDIDTKIMLYMRQTSEDKVEDNLRQEQRNPFTWKFKKGLLLKAAQFTRGKWTRRRMSEPQQDAYIYEAYMKENSDKGVPLTCQMFSTSYNVFGSGLTKFADAMDALNDPRKLWKDRLCASYERHLLKKSRQTQG